MGVSALLPPGVVAAEEFGPAVDATLLPGEEAAIARAVPARRAEFAGARRCARRALQRLGLPPVAIASGPRREPLWPTGVVGSITHCAGYRAAAVATDTAAAGVGIDAEPHEALPAAVLGMVTLPAERAELARLVAVDPLVHWDRLLFSAKESTYKVWYPLTGRWLGFEQATVTVDASAGTFAAQLLVPAPRGDGGPVAFSGRWLVARGLIITAITLPARRAGGPGPDAATDRPQAPGPPPGPVTDGR